MVLQSIEAEDIAHALFVIDITKDDIAVKEANKLGIPVFAVVDSNADPDGINYVIPGNDDALRAIELYCDLVADAVLDGLQAEMSSRGKDLGAAEDVKVELPKRKKKEAEEPTEGEKAEALARTKAGEESEEAAKKLANA